MKSSQKRFAARHALLIEVMRCASGLAHEYFNPDLGDPEDPIDTWVNALYMATRRYLVSKRQLARKS